MSAYQSYVPPSQTSVPSQPSARNQAELQTYPDMPYPVSQVMGRVEHPQATAVLVLGILGLVTSGILAPIAWYMGNSAKRDCEAGLYVLTDPLRIGRVLGIIGTVLLIVAFMLVAFAVFGFIVFAAVS